jgi:hypothetical protein
MPETPTESFVARIAAAPSPAALLTLLASVQTDGSTPIPPDFDPDNYAALAEFNIEVLNAFVLRAQQILGAAPSGTTGPHRILPKSATVGWSNMDGAGGTVIALLERDGDQFYATAAAALRAFAWQSETPESLGYAKTDVVLEFADGETYTAQLDIKHPSLPDHDTDLSRHVISFVEFHSGRLTDAQLPPRVSRKTYETILRRAPDQVPRHAAFRDRYALSDQEIAATLAALAADKN